MTKFSPGQLVISSASEKQKIAASRRSRKPKGVDVWKWNDLENNWIRETMPIGEIGLISVRGYTDQGVVYYEVAWPSLLKIYAIRERNLKQCKNQDDILV